MFRLPPRPTLCAFPFRLRNSGIVQISSAVTAAGQRRIHTVFPMAFPRNSFYCLLFCSSFVRPMSSRMSSKSQFTVFYQDFGYSVLLLQNS